MTESQIAKIKRFLGDPEMNGVIKQLLVAKFLQKRDGDVHILAAQTLAVQLLEEGWSDMERYRQNDATVSEKKNIGL